MAIYESDPAAASATVTVDRAGSYTFQVTITNPSDLSVTSSVTVTVAQTLTAIAVTPAPAVVIDTASQMFSASASDQFGHLLAGQPAFIWSVVSSSAGDDRHDGHVHGPHLGDRHRYRPGRQRHRQRHRGGDRLRSARVQLGDGDRLEPAARSRGTLATFTENRPASPSAS